MSGRKGKKPELKTILPALVIVVNLLIIFGFTVEANRTHRKMEELVEQMSYLSDTTSILLSDVNNLRTDVAEMMKDSSSLLESWNIALRSMDFEKQTYTVDIQVVPKEYTDNMGMGIYFGTKSLQLAKEDFRYTGSAELSLDEAYEGNVAILLSDGNSRKTEILSDYRDVRTDLTNVLYGTLSEAPTYEDGNLQIGGTGYVRLEAGDFFDFKELALLVTKDGRRLAKYDLGAMSKGEQKNEMIDSTEAEELPPESSQSLNHLTYSFMLGEKIPTEGGGHIQICLRAASRNGFIFQYDLADFDLEKVKIAAEKEPADPASQEGGDAAEEQKDAESIEAPDSTGEDGGETGENAAAEQPEGLEPDEAEPETIWITRIREGSMVFYESAVVSDPKGHTFALK